MKTYLRAIATILLLVNGAGALYGGWNLAAYPDGSTMHITVELLRHSPFSDYFIPGIVLFIANGLLSFAVLFILYFRQERSAWALMLQGIVLSGWIFVQVLMLRTLSPLHWIFGGTGLILIFTGWLLLRERRLKSN